MIFFSGHGYRCDEGDESMRANFIKIEDVENFVNFVTTLSGKVFLKSGEIKVNAKSIIGSLYIVKEHPQNIVVEVEDPKEKERVLQFLMNGSFLEKNSSQ